MSDTKKICGHGADLICGCGVMELTNLPGSPVEDLVARASTERPALDRERTTVDEALEAWEKYDRPSSLTVAMLADALYGVREARETGR